jgi:TonB-dependent starch-binding outer membrane protein SusC
MTPVSTLRTLLAVLLAAPLLSSPAALVAQDGGALSGMVLDMLDGTPVSGAEVEILGTTLKAKTSAAGAFDFSSVPVGLLNVRVERGGYISVVEQVALGLAEPGTLEVRLLPIAVALREFFVDGRRGSSAGYSVTEVDVKRDTYLTAADVLAANFPGLQMNGNRGVGTGTNVRIRGTGTITGSAAPAIYLDGVPILDHVTPNTPNGVSALSVLSQIPASEVASIRVLRGPSTAVQYPDASNGVILIETHKGGGKRP